MRTTLLDARNSRIPAAIGCCPTDARFVALLNEAQQRLLVEGMWWGTLQRWKMSATDGTIALPSNIASIQAIAICGAPASLRDQIYEFLDNGFGIRGTPVSPSSATGNTNAGSCCWNSYLSPYGCMNEAIFRGNFCTFYEVNTDGNAKSINAVCDRASDVGKAVLFYGYDTNNNWIRTVQNGSVKDGEVIILAQGAGNSSAFNWSRITDIQPPTTLDGQWWLYERDTGTAATRLLGQYQHYDLRPAFARYFFPSIVAQTLQDGSVKQVNLEALVKMEFIPARNDTDYLLIGNLPALKEMVVALNRAENDANNLASNQIIASGLATAKNILDKELDHYLGAGRKMGINIVGSSLGDVSPVPCLE